MCRVDKCAHRIPADREAVEQLSVAWRCDHSERYKTGPEFLDQVVTVSVKYTEANVRIQFIKPCKPFSGNMRSSTFNQTDRYRSLHSAAQ